MAPGSKDRFSRVVSAGLRAGAPGFATASLIMGFATEATNDLQRLGLGAVLFPGIGTFAAIVGGLLLARRVPRSLRVLKVLVAFVLMEGGFFFYLLNLHLDTSVSVPLTSAFGLSIFKISIMAYAVNTGRNWGPAIMAFLVFVTASVGSALVGPLLGYAWGVDGPAIAAAIFVIFVNAGFVTAQKRGFYTRRMLTALEDEDTLRHTRGVVQSRASAVVHDTVLNDLAVLATTEPGPLSPRLSDRLKTTLELLASPNWVLGAEAGNASLDGTVTKPGGVVQRAVDRATAMGLRVNVSGDIASLRLVAPTVEHALGNAVEQCLVNTLKHANTDSAEITVLADESEVSVMVADSGSGFEVDEVADDRMGLRSSIRSRIESVGGSVRIFARPGVGTTILIAVPVATASVSLARSEQS